MSILSISEAASLALHTMVFLASNRNGRKYSSREIASNLVVSEAHLSKVLQRLSKLGYVESIRGPKGGFSVPESALDLTLLEVYEAIEGPLGLRDCLMGTSLCLGDDCIFGGLLLKVNMLTGKYLSETKIGDLTGSFQRIGEK